MKLSHYENKIIFIFSSLGFYIGNHRVKTYDYKSRSLLTTIGMKGTGNGQVRTFWFNTVWANLLRLRLQLHEKVPHRDSESLY